jgi:hypothetical protein
MSNYQGPEQSNPILEYIRNYPYFGSPYRTLELPNLQNVYQLWNAAKMGAVSFLSSADAPKWFGHSLFTTNVKMYAAYRLYSDIWNLFSPDPKRLVMPMPLDATYQAPSPPYSDAELQLERYSSFGTFLWHLAGALDVMTMGLAFLYDFEAIRTTFCPSFEPRPIAPLKIYFSTGVRLLRQVDKGAPVPGQPKPQNLIDVFKKEGLLDRDPSKGETRCEWYEDLKDQRNYYTHIGFPMLYMVSGEWRVPEAPRSEKPASNLTNQVPDFCHDLIDNVHHFIGEVYGCAWADYGSFLP